MRSRPFLITFIVISLLLFFFTAQTVFAGDKQAIRQMAEVMLNLKHYPSASDRKMLQDISLNTENADDERIIATAMMNVYHQVHSADKPRLKAIIKDENTSVPARKLATIMLNLDHTLNESDRKTLEDLLKKK